MIEPERIISLDPGGTTGIATMDASTDKIETFEVPNCGEAPGLRALLHVVRTAARRASKVTIIVENFEFRHDETHRDKIDYTAPEVIGAIRVVALTYGGIRLLRPSASLGKGFWTDDKIKKLGLWVPGQRHAMDALRHLLRYRAFDLGHRHLFDPLKPAKEVT